MKEKLKSFMLANWTLPEKALLLTDVLLAGVLFGWLTSPFKRGTKWFCDNSFGPHFSGEDEEFEEVEEEEE